jgi:ribokinase
MIPRELKFDRARLRYSGIIGTGGIGSGKFFVLNGDHTLGREESRSGHFLNITDYCKQHIILHYVKVLLGPSFKVIPVGKVGDDDIGQILLSEMNEAGFDMQWIHREPQASTLFSFCFYYPDGSGGNLTTDNSASSRVDTGYVDKAIPEMQKLGQKGIIMAAPEVPLAARKRLIELGKSYGLFCTASFTTGEIEEVLNSDIIDKIDLIAINADEAAAVAGIEINGRDALAVVKIAVQNLVKRNKKIMVSVTAGKDGSWCWDGANLNLFPAVKVNAISTAGAGDAFFSGIIAGMALGLSLFDAQQLASLVAGLSVCSPHTIHKGIDKQSLNDFLKNSGMNFSETILKLMED